MTYLVRLLIEQFGDFRLWPSAKDQRIARVAAVAVLVLVVLFHLSHFLF